MTAQIMHLVVPALTLGGLGLVSSAILLWASKRFAVQEDPRVEQIAEMLPGANCGACGFAGCRAFAQGIAADPGAGYVCPVAPPETMVRIGELLGVEMKGRPALVASLKCGGRTGVAEEFAPYDDIQDCRAVLTIFQGGKICRYACLGLGTCVEVCPVDAMRIVDGIVVIDHETCTGCGLCVEICPRDVLELVPRGERIRIACANPDKGAYTRKICSVGCIGCKRCEKACESGAIVVENNLAVLDYSKCVVCGKCVEVCPTGTIIWEQKEERAEKETPSPQSSGAAA